MFPDIDSEDPRERTQARFYATLGFAVHTWAWLEFGVNDWFTASLGRASDNYHQSKAIFHSPKSFTGSLDLLEVAFRESFHYKEYGNLFKALRKRTYGYYGFRNQIVHGIVTYDVSADLLIIQSHSTVHRPSSTERRTINLEDLQVATKNFEALGSLWAQSRPDMAHLPDRLKPQEALQLVLQLPTEAFSSQLTPPKLVRRPRS